MPKSYVLSILALCAVLLGVGAPTLAHHTYVAKYDSTRLITLSGTVSNVRFSNPHIFFELATGGGASWTIETESIPVARSLGLSEAMLKDGARVTVTGWPSKDGGAEFGLKTISLADGKTITMRKSAR